VTDVYYNNGAGVTMTPLHLVPSLLDYRVPTRSQSERIVEADITGASGSWPTPDALERRFRRLARRWKRETQFSSSIHDLATRDSYQRIIGMGPLAVPLILKEMNIRPGFWFWALRAITGVDPVRKNELGDIEKMTSAWLRWGERNGFSV
jgi:hypothetical protein